jgi:LysR family transcriptional regulator, cyn operon transcriptional activator
MNLRFLHTFVAIADNGGVARAAARLNLTQSAASRQIQVLEDELGLRLFARIGRGTRLTPEGEDLLERSRRLLFDAAALGERASALKSGEVGVLRVGATPQTVESLLAVFLLRYRKRHIGVDVHLVEEGGARLPSRLERGDIDVAIMPAGDDRFRGRLLYPMYLLAVLPQRHDLARRTTLDVTVLADELLLRLTPSFASHNWFDAACHVAHVRPRILHESVAAQTLIALAKAGHGIALVPSPVRIARAGVSIAVVTHRELPLGVWTVAAWDPQRHLAPFASKFIEEVADYCQRDYPGHEYVRKAPRLPKPKAE